jgi:hypothetical protein
LSRSWISDDQVVERKKGLEIRPLFRLKTKCRIRGTRESNRSDFVASALKSKLIAEHQI